MKYCSKCGKEINENAVVCIHCGCAVSEINEGTKNFNVFGLVGFVISIVSFFLTLYCVTSILGIIFSSIGLKKANDPIAPKGKGFAIAGLIVSIISLIYCLIAVIIIGLIIGLLV